MKKIIILQIFLIFSLILPSHAETVASFNTLHLGWSGKDYIETAKALQDFDIVGLQEVMKETGLIQLVNYLNLNTGSQWKYLISENKVGTTHYKEYYGYVWKGNKVKLIKKLGFYQELSPNDFIREPYAAIFKINNFDFTFVLCHSIFGKRKSDRRNEAQQLFKVYHYFQTINGTEQDIIIAGDFNLPGNDRGFQKLLSIKDMTYGIHPSNKTTLGKYGTLVSSYDNFFYNRTDTVEIFYCEVHNYIEIYGGIPTISRKKVSDHLPIFCEVTTNIDDD